MSNQKQRKMAKKVGEKELQGYADQYFRCHYNEQIKPVKDGIELLLNQLKKTEERNSSLNAIFVDREKHLMGFEGLLIVTDNLKDVWFVHFNKNKGVVKVKLGDVF